MKILIISQFFYPDTFLINDIAVTLVKMGHQVEVVTGLPDYSTSLIPEEYRWCRKRKEYYQKVKVLRVSTIARRKGFFFRILNYMSYVFSASLNVLFSIRNADVVFVYGMSPVFQGIPAIVYQLIAKVKVVHYCCDLWPESLKAWNVSERSVIFKVAKKLSTAIYRSSDIVAITSRPFRQYLIDVCGVDNDKMIYLPQHFNDSFCEIAGQYEENECIDFLFAGNLGSVQDIPVIIKAAAIIKTDQKFRVHIVGDGSELGNLKLLVQSLRLGDLVTFHGRHPPEMMAGFYKMADCLLLTLRGGDFIGMTLPSKAQGYLCAGKPILAAVDGAGYELVQQADCGEAVPAGDVEGLASIMLRYIQNPEAYVEKGLNGRRYYEKHFTKEIFMQRLVEILS